MRMLVVCWSQSSFFTSEMSALSSVWTVLGNKQTNKTCEINYLESSWKNKFPYGIFSFSTRLFCVRKTQSKIVKLQCTKQLEMNRRGSQMRPRVCKHPARLPALSFNRTEEDEEEWARTRGEALERLTERRAIVVADATQWLQWEENQMQQEENQMQHTLFLNSGWAQVS